MNFVLWAVMPLLAIVYSILPSSVQAQNSIGCFVPIQCVGAISVGIGITDTPKDCFDYCLSIPDCLFFTHFDDSNTCFAYANCPETNDDCTDCVSGTFLCFRTPDRTT